MRSHVMRRFSQFRRASWESQGGERKGQTRMGQRKQTMLGLLLLSAFPMMLLALDAPLDQPLETAEPGASRLVKALDNIDLPSRRRSRSSGQRIERCRAVCTKGAQRYGRNDLRVVLSGYVRDRCADRRARTSPTAPGALRSDGDLRSRMAATEWPASL